jgi:hypothetical protein
MMKAVLTARRILGIRDDTPFIFDPIYQHHCSMIDPRRRGAVDT